MGRVLLVRHGQASAEAADYDVLSERGFAQSAAVGRALAARGVRPDVVVRGDLVRHRQTLDTMVQAAGWNADVTIDAGWDEYDHEQLLTVLDADPDFVATPGAGFGEVMDRALGRWALADSDPAYAEPFPAFSARVHAAAEAVFAAAVGSGTTALVVSSGGPISWVVTELIAAAHPTWRRLNTTAVNTAITTIAVGRRGASVISINEHAHLTAEAITYR